MKTPLSAFRRIKNSLNLFPWNKTSLNYPKEGDLHSNEDKFNDLIQAYNRYGNSYGIKSHFMHKIKRSNFMNYKKKPNFNVDEAQDFEINEAKYN